MYKLPEPDKLESHKQLVLVDSKVNYDERELHLTSDIGFVNSRKVMLVNGLLFGRPMPTSHMLILMRLMLVS